MRADLVDILLGDAERDVDRLGLGNDKQGLRVAGLHDIARRNQDAADAPVDRRADGGIVEIEPGELDLGLAGADGGGKGADLRPGIIHLGLWRIALRRQILQPLHIGHRLGMARAVAGEDGLRFLQLRLQRPRIEPEQHVALVDGLPFPDQRREQLALYPRLDGDGRAGLDGADAIQMDRQVALYRRRGLDRHRPQMSLLVSGDGYRRLGGEG